MHRLGSKLFLARLSVLLSFLLMATRASTAQGAVDESFTNTLGMRFVRIPPGTFSMGPAIESSSSDSNQVDRSACSVTLSAPFFILTDAVSDRYLKQAGMAARATDISWKEAGDFCAWLSRKDGRTYRLPTEAQW